MNKKFSTAIIAGLVSAVFASLFDPAFARHKMMREESVEYKTTTYLKEPALVHDDDIKKELDHVIDSHRELDDDVAFRVRDGVVTLRGVVDNSSESQLAESLVREIKGVRRIENVIRVEGGWL